MAKDKWEVEGALNEVVRAIQDGSSLSITGLEDGYKKRYYRDFKDHWDSDMYDSWPYARQRILTLAEMVGSLATTLTIYQAFATQQPIPRTVDKLSAYLAGHIVAHTVCPSEGQWCMHYDDNTPLPSQVDLGGIENAFKELICAIDAITKQILPPSGRTGGDK